MTLPAHAGVLETASAVRAGEATAEEVTKAALARIDALNPALNAFLQVFHDESLERARAIDARIAKGGDPGPLAGVPIAIKDNICLSWGKTTCASRMLEHYESPFTATAAQRLLDAGAVLVGKTNLDEFAMGSSNEHSAFGPVRNPWDTARVPGGSSGGSAAAVASGMVPAALGSDTGGSIRQPAGLCGCVGLKPTYGRVSRSGLVAFASSLDQIGPLTRSVQDAALIARIISGPDPLDATTSPLDAEQIALFDDASAPLTLGIPPETTGETVDPRAREVLLGLIGSLRAAGVRTVDVELPLPEHAIAAYYIVAPAEASSNLARFDGVRYGHRAQLAPNDTLDDLYIKSRAEGLGPEVRRRIVLGTHVLSSGYHDAYYTTALRARRIIKSAYDDVFDRGVDAVLLPASPGPAFRLAEKLEGPGIDPMALYFEDAFTVSANLAGLPGISVPAGFVDEAGTRLPIGIQCITRAHDEATALRAAHAIEQITGAAQVAPAGATA
ncbi:MAG: Asp-tRNA(Asn)/Glu-tRNA(Gln) amidotransferase subunit GatA [Planctomycetota bacterium]